MSPATLEGIGAATVLMQKSGVTHQPPNVNSQQQILTNNFRRFVSLPLSSVCAYIPAALAHVHSANASYAATEPTQPIYVWAVRPRRGRNDDNELRQIPTGAGYLSSNNVKSLPQAKCQFL